MDIIDVWTQHPTKRLLQESMFDSLKRWTGQDAMDVPVELTVAAMQSAGISKALLSAWYGPNGPLISNDEVLELTSPPSFPIFILIPRPINRNVIRWSWSSI